MAAIKHAAIPAANVIQLSSPNTHDHHSRGNNRITVRTTAPIQAA